MVITVKVWDLSRLRFPCKHNLKSAQIPIFYDFVIKRVKKLTPSQEQNHGSSLKMTILAKNRKSEHVQPSE